MPTTIGRYQPTLAERYQRCGWMIPGIWHYYKALRLASDKYHLAMGRWFCLSMAKKHFQCWVWNQIDWDDLYIPRKVINDRRRG